MIKSDFILFSKLIRAQKNTDYVTKHSYHLLWTNNAMESNLASKLMWYCSGYRTEHGPYIELESNTVIEFKGYD